MLAGHTAISSNDRRIQKFARLKAPSPALDALSQPCGYG